MRVGAYLPDLDSRPQRSYTVHARHESALPQAHRLVENRRHLRGQIEDHAVNAYLNQKVDQHEDQHEVLITRWVTTEDEKVDLRV